MPSPVPGFYDVAGWWLEGGGSSHRGYAINCCAGLISGARWAVAREPLPRRRSVCLRIKMQLTAELSERAVTKPNVICTTMASLLSTLNYRAWSFRPVWPGPGPYAAQEQERERKSRSQSGV